MRLLSTLSFIVLIASIAAPAQAQERWPRWYVGVSAGLDFIEDTDLSGSLSGDLDVDNAFAFKGALGYMPYFDHPFLDTFRIEAELGIRQASLNSFTNGAATTAASGDLRMVSYMANLLYDFNTQTQWTPYLGAGLGGATVKVDRASGLGNTSEKDTVFAYQFLAGITYAPSSIPLTEWGLGYRYFGAVDPEFGTGATPLKLDSITSHGIEANARFRF